jgi:mannose-6-phosphate isomerase-like protein (cupin superfamily)
MRAWIVAVAVTFTLSAAAQAVAPSAGTQSPAPGMSNVLQSPPPGPELKPSVLMQKDVRARLAGLIPAAKAAGSAGATLVDYGSYKLQLSVRTASGGAEVHAHWDDVMMVEQGAATLITGGTVVGGKTDADGETHGLKIEGGQTQTLAPGDMVTVRAGTPHQIMLAPGTVYGAVVVKIHEP